MGKKCSRCHKRKRLEGCDICRACAIAEQERVVVCVECGKRDSVPGCDMCAECQWAGEQMADMQEEARYLNSLNDED